MRQNGIAQAVPSYRPASELEALVAERSSQPETARYTAILGLPALREALDAGGDITLNATRMESTRTARSPARESHSTAKRFAHSKRNGEFERGTAQVRKRRRAETKRALRVVCGSDSAFRSSIRIGVTTGSRHASARAFAIGSSALESVRSTQRSMPKRSSPKARIALPRMSA